MNRIYSHLEQIEMIGQLADLKEQQYQNGLILSAILDLLLEKAILTRQDIAAKAEELEVLFNPHTADPMM